MAPHGKQMTPEEKQIIVALSQQGYSSYKIAEMTGENRRTISKFLRRRRLRESEKNLPRCGRGRKTGVRGDRIMYRMLRSDRRQSLGEITDQFNCQFVTKISSRTVRRRLNFEGYKKHPVCKKTTVSPVNREKRKRFCRSKLMWTVRNHWKKVIFSDETKIEIGNNRKVYAWRKVDDRLRPECNGLYQGRNYKTKFSVMFWGCISYYGLGTLTPVVGNLNSEKYINNLDDNIWPVIAQHFPTSPTYSRRTMSHAMCLGGQISGKRKMIFQL